MAALLQTDASDRLHCYGAPQIFPIYQKGINGMKMYRRIFSTETLAQSLAASISSIFTLKISINSGHLTAYLGHSSRRPVTIQPGRPPPNPKKAQGAGPGRFPASGWQLARDATILVAWRGRWKRALGPWGYNRVPCLQTEKDFNLTK
ncbi:MAG: hypothetical protein JNJ76_12875 [Candidatus Competibacter sp.]|nr:hypothetical protein [Candidatus Competibacter sp.]